MERKQGKEREKDEELKLRPYYSVVTHEGPSKSDDVLDRTLEAFMAEHVRLLKCHDPLLLCYIFLANHRSPERMRKS